VPEVSLVRQHDKATVTIDNGFGAPTVLTDWFLAGSLGAEYFPAERFSAGAEVQLRGIAQGNPSQQSSGSTTGGVFAPSEATLSTRGLLTVRFYL
jgi:hypothetical protein